MFPVLRRVRIRQWAPLLGLVLGLLGDAIGAAFGHPNSWLWFLGGVVVAALVAGWSYVGRHRPGGNRRPR
jgi:hypothetical protein